MGGLKKKQLFFRDYAEFVRANCTDCPIREQRGCKKVDPLDCVRAAELCKKQNDMGYEVAIGIFKVCQYAYQEGGEG